MKQRKDCFNLPRDNFSPYLKKIKHLEVIKGLGGNFDGKNLVNWELKNDNVITHIASDTDHTKAIQASRNGKYFPVWC
jgi:hypothetical protein